MYSGAGEEAGLRIEREAVDLALEDVGVVRHGGQVEAGGVLAPRRVDRLVELPLLVLAERHPPHQKAPPNQKETQSVNTRNNNHHIFL